MSDSPVSPTPSAPADTAAEDNTPAIIGALCQKYFASLFA